MNPERDTHDNTDLANISRPLLLQADASRKRWVREQRHGGWFGFIRLPGEVGRLRNEYLETAGRTFRIHARIKVNEEIAAGAITDDVAYRHRLAEELAALYIQDLKETADAGVNEHQPSNIANFSDWLSRRRVWIGVALNIGIGASMFAGLVPVTALLTAARVTLPALSTQRLLLQGNDLFSRKLGARKKAFISPAQPIEAQLKSLDHQLASFYGYRHRKRIDKALPEESALYPRYQELTRQLIENRLTTDGITNHGGTVPPAPGVAADLDDSLRNAMLQRSMRAYQHREHALGHERRWQFGAFVLGAAISTGLTLGLSPQAGHAMFTRVDEYHQTLINHGDVSSLHGMAQNEIAKAEMGIDLDGHLVKGDPLLNKFWSEWDGPNHKHYEAAASAWEHWVRINNPTAIYTGVNNQFGHFWDSDYVVHNVDLAVPVNPIEFFKNVIPVELIPSDWPAVTPDQITHFPTLRVPWGHDIADRWDIWGDWEWWNLEWWRKRYGWIFDWYHRWQTFPLPWVVPQPTTRI